MIRPHGPSWARPPRRNGIEPWDPSKWSERLKGARQRVDDNNVLRSTPSVREVHARVTTLPQGFLVRKTGAHWVVVGPTGLFLVGKAEDNPAQAAERTAMAAHRLRNHLAEVLDVVPFVDPVVVADEPGHELVCAMVRVDLLASFLCSGPEVVNEGELQLLRHHVPAVLTSLELTGGLA